MKKFLKRACLIILLLIIAYIIYLQTIYDYNFYSSLIEIPIPIFAKMEEKDTHWGFHGDGETLIKFYFSDKQAQNFTSNISNNLNWNEFPIPETLQHYAYNSIDKDTKIPFINNGYWFFLDRHSKATDRYNYYEMCGRTSSNYSVAIFDIDSNILYIYSLDT